MTVYDSNETSIEVTDGSFTMPADKVLVFAAFTANDYTVTIGSGITNGTLEADKTSANVGDTVTLTATPAAGYALDTLTVTDGSGAAVTVTDGTFTMPASNVTAAASFRAIDYTITIDPDITNGTLQADKTSANMGDTVTLTAKPGDGYGLVTLADIIVTDGEGNTVTVGEDGTFTMPADNVTARVTFLTQHTITLDSNVINNDKTVGTIASDKTAAVSGETVTLTVTSYIVDDLGSMIPYLVDGVTVVRTDDSTTETVELTSRNTSDEDGETAVSIFTFVMPDSSVTVGGTGSRAETMTVRMNGGSADVEVQTDAEVPILKQTLQSDSTQATLYYADDEFSSLRLRLTETGQETVVTGYDLVASDTACSVTGPDADGWYTLTTSELWPNEVTFARPHTLQVADGAPDGLEIMTYYDEVILYTDGAAVSGAKVYADDYIRIEFPMGSRAIVTTVSDNVEIELNELGDNIFTFTMPDDDVHIAFEAVAHCSVDVAELTEDVFPGLSVSVEVDGETIDNDNGYFSFTALPGTEFTVTFTGADVSALQVTATYYLEDDTPHEVTAPTGVDGVFSVTVPEVTGIVSFIVAFTQA